MQGSVRVTGEQLVMRALSAVGFHVVDPDDALDDIAVQAQRQIVAATPKVSGYLASTVETERGRGRAAVAARAPYAGPINYGWQARGITGAGFMQEGDPALASYSVRRLDQSITQSIRKQGL